MTSVHVNTTAYAHTHVATSMLRGLRQIVLEAGLDQSRLVGDWHTLEAGVTTWIGSGHLRALMLEIIDPSRSGSDLVGRFDFTIDYGYYGDGDGELWLDPETIRFAVRKAGTYPDACTYRVVADTAPNHPPVSGWSGTTLRDTSGFTRHTTGTAVGGGHLGASLSYHTRK